MAKKKHLTHEKQGHIFHVFSQHVAKYAGHWLAFILALASILLWLASGFLFDFSDTWQLVINTSTTIITFLMVFIIQNTQNRENRSTQIKIDELIRVHKLAHNSVIDLDKLSDRQIEELEAKFNSLSQSR